MEEIDLHKCEILELWFVSDEKILDRLISSYIAMVSQYGKSENIQYYRYKTAYYLYRAGRYEASKEVLGIIDSPEPDVAELIRILEEQLGNVSEE